MKDYVIVVEEKLRKAIVIHAESKREAIQKIQDSYDKEKIILSAEDFFITNIFDDSKFYCTNGKLDEEFEHLEKYEDILEYNI